MPLVILVGGRLTAGKDEFADRLVAEHGFRKLGMSDTLAEALYTLNPVIPIHDDWRPGGPIAYRYRELVDGVGYVEAKKNPEVRRLLQVLGTEVGRRLLDSDIWVKAAKRKILRLVDFGHDVVLTGIRFENEIALDHELNDQHGPNQRELAATSVWVDRPSLPIPDPAAHASEASLSASDFQYVLTNDKDLKALREASDGLLDTIRRDYDLNETGNGS